MVNKKYRSPILLAEGPVTPPTPSEIGEGDSVREMKDELASSFVYGDDNYEEEYIVPDVLQEVISESAASKESGE